MHRIAFLLGLVVATFLAERAIAGDMKPLLRIGFLSPAEAPGLNHRAFLDQLKSLGYEEGKNLQIVWAWARQDYDKMPALASMLVGAGVHVLVAQTQAAAQAAQKATSKIPIVFVGVRDPVAAGLVKSMGRPQTNLTGVTLSADWALAAKPIEILSDLDQDIRRVGIIFNPAVAVQSTAIQAIKNALTVRKIEVEPFGVRTVEVIESAIAKMKESNIRALMVLVESFTLGHRVLLARRASENEILTAFEVRDYVDAGGLLSYGLSYTDHYAQGAKYVSRIAAGENPSDIPVEQPSRFEFVLNLDAARSLRLQVPPTLLTLTTDTIGSLQ